MIALDFKDSVVIYPVRKDGYGNDVADTGVTVPALYEQTTGYEHANNRDAVSGVSRLYLPANNEFVLARAQRLEGMVVKVNLFGGESVQQLFRIVSVTPVRDILLGNDLQHVECELRKIAGVSNVG